MTEKVPFLRRQFFIDKKFQARFILVYFIMLLIGTSLFSGVAYYILNRNIGDTLWSAHLAITKTGEMLRPVLLYLSLTFILILGAAVALFTLIISHKISGPLYAMNRYLKMMSSGNLRFEAKVRTDDQVATLAETLTETVRTLNGRVSTLKDDLHNLSRDLLVLENLVNENGSVSSETVRQLHDTKEQLRVLEERIGFFQTE